MIRIGSSNDNRGVLADLRAVASRARQTLDGKVKKACQENGSDTDPEACRFPVCTWL